MKNFYEINRAFVAKKHFNFLKQFLTLLALLATSVNAWGATLTAKVAVGSGKGTARVEVYSRWGGGAQDAANATDGTQKTASMGGITIVSWGYSKYTATAADGYTFDAWYTNAACTSGKQTGNPYTTGNTSGDRTDEYWAKFTPDNYTLTLNKQSGSGGSGNITVTYDSNKNLTGTIAAPTRAGYTFAGYYSEQNGGGVLIIDADGKVQADVYVGDDMYIDENRNWVYVGDLTVYAKWTVNKYTVTFDPNGEGASVGTTSKQVTFDANYGELPIPTRRFYSFAGWYTAANGGSQVTASTKVSTPNNHSIFAHWTLAPEHQTISWNEMPLTMSRNSKQAISLISTSGLTDFDVTSSNPEIIAVSGGYLQAGNTNGTAEITAIQPGNMYFYPDTLKTVFTVSTKDMPFFFENGFSAEGTNELKVDSIVTLNLANVSEGLDGDFTISVAKNGGVMKVVREGNTVTICALHAGQDTITVTQAENDDVYGLTRTYVFNVTRYVPEFLLSKDVLELDETAQLTLIHVDDASIAFVPEGKVSYDGSTGTITARELGTTTLTVSQAETNSIAQRTEELTITVTKKTPTLRILVSNEELSSMSVEQGSTVLVDFDRASDAEMTVTNVSGAQYASYVDGVFTAAAVGTAVFRATLPETDKYFGVTKDFSLTVTANTNHVPVFGKSYTVGLGSAVDWTHKYETLSFKGVPDKLSFNFAYIYQVQANIGNPTLNYDQLSDLAKAFIGIGDYSDTRKGVGNTHMLYVEQSPDGRHWTTIWTDDDASSMDERSSGELQLDKDTRYLRFHHSCNFSNSYSNIQISELKYVENPEPATIDLGTAVINSGEVSAMSLVNWCNVAPLSVTSSNPRFTVSPTQFGNYEQYGSQELTISYTHTNEAGANEADITISNGVQTRTIHVTAVTTKRPQAVTWNNDFAATGFAMNVGEQYPDEMYVPVVAAVTSGQRITFTSDNEDVVEVVADTALLAKAVGTANITAYSAGDAEYQEVSDTKTFQVTNKQKQSILWEQNFYGLLTTSEPVELTATATSGGEITYASGNESVVTVSGNILTVVGEGETYITATQAGFTDANEVEWLGVSQNNYVIVRNPALQCNDLALSQGSLTLNSSKKSQDYNLSGIPATLTFTAKHGTKTNSTWGEAVYSALIVEQYAKLNGLWDWYQVYNNVVGTSDTQSGNISLDETATKLRIRTLETGTDHTISNIRVTRAKFMRADVAAVDLEVESNSVWQQAITVSHSNIDLMTITSKQGLLQFNTSTLGEGCGDFGDDAFTASFTPTIKNHEYLDTIVITDGKAQPSTIVIPVRLYSQGLNQTITDFELPATAVATDVIPVSATASSGLPVSFESSNSEVAYVENGVLKILKADTVTITAKQDGNDKYNAAPSVAKTITISKVASAINVAPTAADITYGQTLAEAALSGGQGSVEGTFAWETPAAVPAAGTQTYTVVFTPALSGIYSTASTLVSVKVAKATPMITRWPDASDITIAQAVGQSLLTNGEASVEGTFAWKNPTENRLPHGAYERAVVFTPTDPSYNTVEGMVNLYVANVLAKVLEAPVAVAVNPVYGITLADVLLQGGSANVEGSFAWKDSTQTPQAGTHDYTVVFTPTDLELYSPVEIGVGLTVAKAATEITALPQASVFSYGLPLSDCELTGGEGSVAGAFVWAHPDTVPALGTGMHDVIFVPEDSVNYAVATAQVSVTTVKRTQEIAWETTPAVMVIDDELVLNATATSGLDVVFSVSDETVASVTGNVLRALAEGTVTITAAQPGNDYYEAAESIERQLVVRSTALIVPQIIWTPVATSIYFGQPLSASRLEEGEANVEGIFRWVNDTLMLPVGTHTAEAVFVPTDTLTYTTVSLNVEVSVLVPPTTYSTYTAAFCSGDSAEFRGVWYHEAVETEILLPEKNSLGGDSIVRLTVTVHPVYAFADAQTIYRGAQQQWQGYDLSVLPVGDTTLVAAYTSVNGCDSVYTLSLTVLVPPTTYGSYAAAFCAGDSVQFDGVWYNSPVDTEVLLTQKNHLGGDSIVHLTVAVHPTYAFADSLTTHQRMSDTWQGIALGQLPVGDTTLVMGYTAVEGCDSTYTLHLSVLPQIVTYGHDTIRLCAGERATYEGKTYRRPTRESVLLSQPNQYGGDSIVELVVYVFPAMRFSADKSIREKDAETWQGYDLSIMPVGDTTLVAAYTSVNGCDSTYTLHLSVLPRITTYGNDTIRLCAGEQAEYEGKIYSQATTDSVLLSRPNQYGCDSIVELVVYVFPVMQFQEELTVRERNTETWQGYDLSMLPVGDTTLVAPYTSVNGCDSTYTLHLTVLPCITTYGNDTIRLCAGEQAEYEGKIYTQSTVDSVLLSRPNQYGCDSIVELVVEVFPVMQFQEELTIRERHAETWQGYDLSVLPAGDTTLVAPYTSVHGCDSVYTLHLSVLPWITTYGNDTVRFCEGDEAVYEGKIYTQSATDSILLSLPNQYGCDSIVVLVAEMYPVAHDTAEQTITEGENLTWQGYDLSLMPVGDTTLVAAYTSTHGCDSTYTLRLTVLPKLTTYGNDTIRLCEGDEMEYEGKIYTQSTVDSVLLSQPNQYGGDSIVELVVQVFPVTFISEEDSITKGDNVNWQGYDLSELPVGDTTLVAIYTSVNGCDSIYTLHLIVLPDLNEAIEPVEPTESYRAEKYFRDGLIYIRKGDAWYDLMGVRIQ